jgi:hypothetical protein
MLQPEVQLLVKSNLEIISCKHILNDDDSLLIVVGTNDIALHSIQPCNGSDRQ